MKERKLSTERVPGPFPLSHPTTVNIPSLAPTTTSFHCWSQPSSTIISYRTLPAAQLSAISAAFIAPLAAEPRAGGRPHCGPVSDTGPHRTRGGPAHNWRIRWRRRRRRARFMRREIASDRHHHHKLNQPRLRLCFSWGLLNRSRVCISETVATDARTLFVIQLRELRNCWLHKQQQQQQ